MMLVGIEKHAFAASTIKPFLPFTISVVTNNQDEKLKSSLARFDWLFWIGGYKFLSNLKPILNNCSSHWSITLRDWSALVKENKKLHKSNCFSRSTLPMFQSNRILTDHAGNLSTLTFATWDLVAILYQKWWIGPWIQNDLRESQN